LRLFVDDEEGPLEENMDSFTTMFALPGGPTPMIAHQTEADKALPLLPLLHELLAFIQDAAEQGQPAHEVERGLWRRLLGLGHQALGLFFDRQGDGDLGPTLPLPDGRTAQRLEQRHPKDYRSVFGAFRLQRAVYGSREGQKIDLVPLDARLQLPAGDYSYLLQEWDQLLGVEQAFGRVAQTLGAILGLAQSVDSLEQHNRHWAEHVAAFREAQPPPPAPEEGEVMVVQADGKGIVMRRDADRPRILAHRKKGDKASHKRMATVGAIYSIGRHTRTAEDIIEALFRDPKQDVAPKTPRPLPRHKHLWASLTHQQDGVEVPGSDVVFGWLAEELRRRDPREAKEVVYLMDGQDSLWEARQQYLRWPKSVEILDLLHVTPRLWEAAHLFEKEGSDEAVALVREQLLRILQGKVGYVVGGLRQKATKRGLAASKQKRLETICGYLLKNRWRLRYDEYLARGYPIASGVIEGACRHYVKDRMERAGMHWTHEGAQAMLDVRSVYLNGDWEAFQQFRITRETERLYPHRQILEAVQWSMAV
jgi:hypothetical protein